MNDVQKDPLALGLGSLAYGIGMGATCLISAQILVFVLHYRLDPADFPVIDPLQAGAIAAVALGGSFAWYRSWALDNIWQRGVIAVLAAVGALIFGFITAPLEGWLGLRAMIVWLIISIAFGLAGNRWALRGRGTTTS